MMLKKLGAKALGLCLLLTCVPYLHGQSTYGSIQGVVTDASGAAIPQAKVTLTNKATAETQSQMTGDAGLYSFVNLVPGNYEVSAEKTGFKRVTEQNVVVQVQQTTRVDLPVSVGEATETVTVSSTAPILQPETSSLGQVVETRNANELPLNGRNIFSLVEVAPSVVLQGGAGQTATGQNPFAWGNFQIGGAFANQSAEYLDGEPLNIGYINLPILIPTQDSIGEFKVQTNNLGPEWGRLAGGVLNLSTKSGSNAWHGEVYEYLRNKVLNTADWFSNNQGLPEPAYTQNQFGGNFGGRVIKDKSFFFFQYEGFRQRFGETFTTTVPTAAERTGNVSALVPLSAVPGNQIIDPCAGAATCNTYTPVPFAGNVIPQSRLNPTAVALLKLYPLPTSNATLNNFTTNTSAGGNQNQYVGRYDQAIHQNQHLFGRFSWWNNVNLPIDPLGTGLCQDRCTELYSSRALAIGYNYVLNPTTIANLNVSASRFLYTRQPKNSNFDFTTIGWPAAFNGEVSPALRTPPTPCITGIADSITCSQGQSAIIDRDTQYNFSPSITLVRGRHTLQLGVQYLIDLDNYTQTNTAGGSFGFTGAYTGLALSDFLLGWANNPSNVENHFFGAAQEPALTAGKQKYIAGFVSDTYHATTNLTLNLGLRYEYQSPWTERFNRMSYFDTTAVNPLSNATTGQMIGAVELVDTPGVRGSRYNINAFYHGFAPRIGFAESLDQKTVIRGGYGLFWIPIDANWATNPLNDPVNSIQTNYHGNIAANTPINTITTPWPEFIPAPGRNPSFQGALLGQGITIANPNFKYGYTQQWNLDLQRELPGAFFADIAYSGLKGTHLPQYSQQVDQIGDNYLAQAAEQSAAGQPVAIAQQVTNPYFSVASPGSPLSSATTLAGNLLRPFPQYSGVSYAGQGVFYSNYNSLQATLTRRFNGGGTLLAAYTYSKLLSNTDTITSWLESGGTGAVQDWNNLPGEYSLSSNDVPQRLIISYVLDLPFGHGRQFAANLSPLMDKVVGGWGIDGVTLFQKGFPVNIGAAVNNYVGQFSAGLRPNVAANCNHGTSGSAEARVRNGLVGGDGWINASCYSQPAPYTFGSESRVDPSLRAQGPANFDWAIFKRTTFGPGERLGFEFRTEFFNLFNHPQFGPPGNSFGSSNFGQITSQTNNPRLIQFAGKIIF
jgi:Carboxypeptidase regulatory-like domain